MTRQSKFMKQTLFKHVFKKGFLLTRKVHPDRIWKLPWRRLPSRLPRRRLSPKMRSAAPSSRLPDTNLSCNASQFYTLFGWFAPERTIRRVPGRWSSCKKYWIVLQRTHLKRFTLSLQIVDSPAPSHQPLLHWTLSSAVKNEEHPILMASHPVCEPLLYIALICRAVQFNEI